MLRTLTTPLTQQTDSSEELEISPELMDKMQEAADVVTLRIRQLKASNTKMTVELWQKTISPISQLNQLLPKAAKPEADFWTNAKVAVDLLTFIEKLIWIAALIDDLFAPEDKSPLGEFSWTGLGIGLSASILLTVGEAVCHKIINTVNQAIEYYAPPQGSALSKVKLPFSQKVALACEAISHVGEIGGLCVLITNILGLNNPWWLKVSIHITGTMVLGLFNSVADTRSHYTAMLLYHRADNDSAMADDKASEIDLTNLETGESKVSRARVRITL